MIPTHNQYVKQFLIRTLYLKLYFQNTMEIPIDHFIKP